MCVKIGFNQKIQSYGNQTLFELWNLRANHVILLNPDINVTNSEFRFLVKTLIYFLHKVYFKVIFDLVHKMDGLNPDGMNMTSSCEKVIKFNVKGQYASFLEGRQHPHFLISMQSDSFIRAKMQLFHLPSS